MLEIIFEPLQYGFMQRSLVVAIVLVASGIFVLALLFSPTQGLLTNPSFNFGNSGLLREIKSLIDRQKS